ncbi:hypothetical protein K501DRAFT_195372, partial [Backusella circina FSU 941]
MPHSRDIHSPALPSRSPFRIRDSQLAKIHQSKNERWSLSEELDTLWTIKAHNYASVTPKEPAKVDLTDHLLTQLLISQAVIDSKDYEILSIDNLERLKKNYIEVSDLVSSISRRI